MLRWMYTDKCLPSPLFSFQKVKVKKDKRKRIDNLFQFHFMAPGPVLEVDAWGLDEEGNLKKKKTRKDYSIIL